MFDKLPIELAGEVLRVAAEMFLLSDRGALIAISLSSTFAHRIATKVLYRTLIIEKRNGDPALRVFASVSDVRTMTSILHEPPVQRICPLVRRVFVEWESSFEPSDIRHLVNLEALYCLRTLDSSTVALMPPSLKRYYSLAPDISSALSASLTHVSFYIQLFLNSAWSGFLQHSSTFPASIAFIALEIADRIWNESFAEVNKMLVGLLSNPKVQVEVVFRLYRRAKQPSSVRVIHRAIHGLADISLQARVKIWHDLRSIHRDDEDVGISKEDALAGRTPWTEARPVTHQELEESVSGVHDDEIYQNLDEEMDEDSDESD